MLQGLITQLTCKSPQDVWPLSQRCGSLGPVNDIHTNTQPITLELSDQILSQIDQASGGNGKGHVVHIFLKINLELSHKMICCNFSYIWNTQVS